VNKTGAEYNKALQALKGLAKVSVCLLMASPNRHERPALARSEC